MDIIKNFLLKRDDIIFVYLYGSFVEGCFFRDIDVALFMREPKNELELESDLSYELTERTGYPVDVRIINNAPVSFQMSVLRNDVLLIRNDEALRTDFIEKIGRKYRDYSHLRNIDKKRN